MSLQSCTKNMTFVQKADLDKGWQRCMIGTRQPERSLVPAALLQQVMQLTPEQIAGLPQDQQAQVLALQQHMVRVCLFFCKADQACRYSSFASRA